MHAPLRAEVPAKFTPTNSEVGDTVDYDVPGRADWRAGLEHGDYRLWSSSLSGGAPLGSAIQIAPLSPIHLPYVATPLWYAPALVKLLELATAIGFTYLFLRRLGLAKSAAILGGLVYAYSGFQAGMTNFNLSQVGAIIPAVFWAIDRSADRKTLGSVVPVALSVGALLMAGFISVAGFGLLAAVVYGAYKVLTGSKGRLLDVLRGGLAPGAGVLLGLGLGAILLLPMAERASVVAESLTWRREVFTPTHHALRQGLATMAIPNTFGSVRDHESIVEHLGIDIEGQFFIGAAAVGLVLVELSSLRSRAVSMLTRLFLWGSLVGMSVLLFVGGPPIALLHRLPLLGEFFATHPIGRLRSVFLFFLAILAALGLQAVLERRTRENVRRGRFFLLGGTAFVVTAYALIWLRFDDQRRAYLLRQSLLPALSLATTVVLAFWLWRRPSRSSNERWALAVIPAFVALEALLFVLPLWPRVPKSLFYPVTSTHRYLLREAGTSRLATEGLVLLDAQFHGFRTVTANEELLDPAWRELVDAADPNAFRVRTLPFFGFLTPTTEVITSPILDRLSARFFVADPRWAAGIGRTEVVSSPDDGALVVRNGDVFDVAIDPRPLRGVVLELASPIDKVYRRLSFDVKVVDALGRGVTDGERRLYGAESGALVVPVVEPRTVGEHPAPWRARVSLSGDGEIHLRQGESGPALSTVSAVDDGLRVTHVKGALIYDRLKSLDRFRWATRTRVVPSEKDRVRVLSRPLAREEVVLHADGPKPSGESARLQVVEDDGDTIRLAVRARGSGYLVVADALQDPGWHATVDGRPAEVLPADHALVAVHLPRGDHDVVLRYRPSGWVIGQWVSGLAFLATLGLALMAWQRRRRDRSHQPPIRVGAGE